MHKNKYRVVVFDLDGTLVDSFDSGLQTCLDVASSLGLPITREIISSLSRNWGRPTADLIKPCWPAADYKIFRDAFNREHLTATPRLFDGVAETLGFMRERMSLGIFTSRKVDSAVVTLGKCGIRQFFDYIRTQSHFPYDQKKPHPAGLWSIVEPLSAVGIRPEDVLYVGDGIESDLPCAREAGIDFVAITESKNVDREQFVQAGLPSDRILSSVRQLAKFLAL